MPQSAESKQDRAPQPGDVALALLAPEWAAGIVGELAGDPLRPAELERRLAGIPHATLMSRIKALSRRKILHDHLDSPRRATYALTERGRGLEEIVAAAALIERTQPDFAADRQPGERALRIIAHPYNRAIRRVLANGPLTLAEIERGLPGVAHSSVNRQLHELREAGVVTAGNGSSGRKGYALALDGRRLALLALLAARWELRWADGEARATSDVGGLVHMIAPLAQIAPGFEGACRLHVEDRPSEPDIDISAAKGKLATLPLPPTVAFEAQARASAREWGRALLRCDPAGIATEGDRVLLGAVVIALGAALRV